MASPSGVDGIEEYDEEGEIITHLSTEDPLSWTTYYEHQNYFFNISYGDSRWENSNYVTHSDKIMNYRFGSYRWEEIENNPLLISASSLRIRVWGMNSLECKYPLRWGILTERSTLVGRLFALRAYRIAKLLNYDHIQRTNYRTAQEVPLDYWEIDWIMSLESCYAMFAANHMLMPYQGVYSIPSHTRMHFSCPCGRASAKWRMSREVRSGFPGLHKLGIPQCGENGLEDSFPSMRRLMMHLFRNRRDCLHEAAYCYMSVMYGGIRRYDYLRAQLMDNESAEYKEYLYWYNTRNEKRLHKIYGVPAIPNGK